MPNSGWESGATIELTLPPPPALASTSSCLNTTSKAYLPTCSDPVLLDQLVEGATAASNPLAELPLTWLEGASMRLLPLL